MTTASIRTYKPLPIDRKCSSCGDRLFLKKTTRTSGDRLFECVNCVRIYSSTPEVERDHYIHKIKANTTSLKEVWSLLHSSWKQTLRKELEVFISDPSAENEKKLCDELANYKDDYEDRYHPLISHFKAQLKRGPGQPRGTKKKRNPVLSVLIAISVNSGMLTPSQVLDALGMEKSSNNYSRFIPIHIEQGARLVERLNLFPRGKTNKPNPRNPKIMVSQLMKFSKASR